MKYKEKAKFIWSNFVPKEGQADTVQGELLRAVEKLRYEATVNRNLNWDDDFVYFIDLLRKYLTNESDTSKNDQINRDLNRLLDFNFPVMDNDIYDRLVDNVVEWYDSNKGENKLDKNPLLNR